MRQGGGACICEIKITSHILCSSQSVNFNVDAIRNMCVANMGHINFRRETLDSFIISLDGGYQHISLT